MRTPPLDPLKNGDLSNLIPVSDFIERCKTQYFIDYDGHAYWATLKGSDRSHVIHPSMILKDRVQKPDWATHVEWFNR